MNKPKITSFFKNFFIINAILFVIYLAVTTIVGMFFGDATIEFSTDVATGEDQSVFLTVFYSLLQLAAFFGFYVFSLFRFEKDTEEKRSFLNEIGTERFDSAAYSRKYFSEKGKYMLIYFSATVGILSVARLIGVPFSNILVFSQSMPFNVLIIAVGVKSVLMIAVVFPVTVAANIALYYIYQRFICVKVYEKWAKERLRIN